VYEHVYPKNEKKIFNCQNISVIADVIDTGIIDLIG